MVYHFVALYLRVLYRWLCW